MSSQTVITLKAQLALLDGQINTLLNQSVLVDHSLDGQSFSGGTGLDKLLDRKEKLLVLLRQWPVLLQRLLRSTTNL